MMVSPLDVRGELAAGASYAAAGPVTAHTRLHRQLMFQWIEERLTRGAGGPTDAEICDRFGFASAEQARTLLAELADAGRITIRGWGDDRKIVLGRQRHRTARSARPEPSVKRPDQDDPEVERVAAIISAIARRGRRPAPAAAVESIPTPSPQEEQAVPNPPPSVDFRNVNVLAKGRLLTVITEKAQAEKCGLGKAAAMLIEDGVRLAAAPAEGMGAEGTGPRFEEATLAQLLDAVRIRMTEQGETARAATKRAEAAEAKLTAAQDHAKLLLAGL